MLNTTIVSSTYCTYIGLFIIQLSHSIIVLGVHIGFTKLVVSLRCFFM